MLQWLDISEISKPIFKTQHYLRDKLRGVNADRVMSRVGVRREETYFSSLRFRRFRDGERGAAPAVTNL